MPRIDLNEVSGFISACENAPYLIDLYNHVGLRLQALGVAVALYQSQPLAEGSSRSPALAEEPGPDLFATQPVLPSSLSEELPLRPIDEASPPPTLEVPAPPQMPDYSKFPDGLREKLEQAWKDRNGVA